MQNEKYIIQINEEKRPFNVYLVLPLSVLKKVHALLQEEIMKGQVDGDQEDNIILHLLLDKSKILQLKELLTVFKKEPDFKVK